MPDSIAPQADGDEVGSFHLLPIDDIAQMVRDEDVFKPNCNLVIIDFLLRHGLLTAENEPDFEAIVKALRRAG
jgi:hypothetical protein